MAAKRKTLPKDFDSLIRAGGLDALLAVFDGCELDAYGGSYKQTALAFSGCPPELARQLVARGLDVDAVDSYGATPLCRQSGQTSDVELLETLLELGADIEATANDGSTPLYAAAGLYGRPEAMSLLLSRGARVDVTAGYPRRTPLSRVLVMASDGALHVVVRSAEKARLLLEAGATIAPEDAETVARIGRAVEFHRKPDRPQPHADAALAFLYGSFGVTPAPARVTHDGVSRITVSAEGVTARFRELWSLLVPSQGPAATVQGEAIRLAGRLGREILDNGSGNWDDGFRAMTDALVRHLGQGVPAAAADELESLRRTVRTGAFDQAAVDRLTELAVAWVVANPDPQPLPAPGYGR